MNTAGESFSVTVNNRREQLIAAAELYDSKNSSGTRRGIQLLAAMYVLFLFIKNAFDRPEYWLSWVCLVAGAAFAYLIWNFPRISNRRFAEVKMHHAPQVVYTFGEDGFTVDEQPGVYRVGYDENGLQIWEYKGCFVLSFGKGHLAAIGQDQLSPEETDKLRELFQNRTPDRFAKVETIKKMK